MDSVEEQVRNMDVGKSSGFKYLPVNLLTSLLELLEIFTSA